MPAALGHLRSTRRTAFPLAVAVLLGAYVLVPRSAGARPWLYELSGVAVVVAAVVGLRLRRPEYRLPWILLTCALALWVTGDTIQLGFRLAGIEPSYPSSADIAYGAAYPIALLAAVLVSRRGRPSWVRGLLDSAIVALSVGLGLWAFVFEPVAHDFGARWTESIVAAAYPTFDIAVAGALLPLVVARRGLQPALAALILGYLAFACADVLYGLESLRGTYQSGALLDAGWLLGYSLIAFSVLTPSMRSVGCTEARPVRMTNWRLLLLGAATVVAPAALILPAVPRENDEIVGIAGAAIVVLVLVRLLLLLGDHRRVEEHLRLSDARFRGAFESSPIGMAIISTSGRYLQANPSLCAMLGYLESEIHDKHLNEYAHPDDAELSIRLFERMVAAEQDRWQLEKRHIRQDGSMLWLGIVSTLVRGADGKPLYVVSQMQDISESKRAEQLEEQLRQAQKMEAVGRLAGGIAHDFNNLLTAIGGYAELALRRVPAEDAKLSSQIGAIHEAADRAASLTQQLLAFGRKQVIQPRVLQLNEVIESADALLRRLIPTEIEMHLDLDPTLVPVRADRSQLDQVLFNLAVNARDAMPGGGRLTIATRTVVLGDPAAAGLADAEPGTYAVLELRDTGVGMDEDTQGHIFEPFFTTKQIGSGTGLGLATVYGIVAQSGGHVAVESRPSLGTSMRIWLPAAQDAIEARDPEVTRTPEAGHETILLVEDDDVVRTLIADMLRESGYEVLEAGDPEKALAFRADYDLVVTDMVMPRMNGRQLADQLRGERPKLRVLYISGYAEEGIGPLDAGSEYLQKPFALVDLGEKVRALLDREVEVSDAA